MSSVKEFLNWCLIFIKSSPQQRKAMKQVLLDGIAEYSEEGKKYAKWLESSQCQFIGFAVNVQYIKENGDIKEREALWVHPFGGPVLLYKHKRLPMLIMSSPSLEFNDSHIKKAKMNNYTQTIEGITD
jgi:hypothetical protein